MTAEDTIWARVQNALGYTFDDIGWLRVALTHRSWSAENTVSKLDQQRYGSDNERLEFLGDSVLGMVISEALWFRVSSSDEGAMSRLRASVVNEGSLAQVAVTLELGAALRLGKGEDRSGGRTRPSLLADAVEAIFAGVYLDGGFSAAKQVVLRVLSDRVDRVLSEGVVDFKSALQERLQASHKVTPKYRLVAQFGPDHDREHEVEIDAEGLVTGRGRGRTKKDAEQLAAKAALAALAAAEQAGITGEQPTVLPSTTRAVESKSPDPQR
jgi:ribonuclease-3